MPTKSEITQAAKQAGERNAAEVMARRAVALRNRSAALAAHPSTFNLAAAAAAPGAPAAAPASSQSKGFLLAAGDSWFDYPGYDVLASLHDDFGYNVESSAAHAGQPMETLAYVPGTYDDIARDLETIIARGGTPKAVLLSGGGDDIAGKEFGMLLDSAMSATGGWNKEIVDGVINERIAGAYKSTILSITSLCQAKLGRVVPVLVHGYDYAVPDGRAFLLFIKGPWLKPGFDEKLFSDLTANTAMIEAMIDTFNAMLTDLAGEPEFAHVKYINLRKTLPNDATYKDWWANELHPTHKGFLAVATKFAAELDLLP